MTARERIAKGIREHDEAVEAARQTALVQIREPFRDSMDAFESARGMAKQSGIILGKLSARREAMRIVGLLEYEQEQEQEQKLQQERERTK